MAYGDVRLRQFTDIDVLVLKTQIMQARDLMCAQGHRLALAPSESEAEYRRTRHAYTFVPDRGKELIDLHWAITKRHFAFPLDKAGLWDRLVTIDIAGTPIRSLPPEEMLLIVCVHGTTHHWAELGWMSDVAALVERHPALEWERLLLKTRTLHSERMLLLGLNLAHELLGTPLPSSVTERIQATPAIRKLTGQVRDWLFTDTRSWHQTLAYYVLPARTMGRFRDCARYCQNLIKRAAKKFLNLALQRCSTSLRSAWSKPFRAKS